MPFPVTLDRVFNRTERVRLFAKVFGNQAAGTAKATLEFLDTTGRAAHSVEVASNGQVVDTAVSLNALAPGAYLARISLGAEGPSREVSLVIK
jgi:hypothetical protein